MALILWPGESLQNGLVRTDETKRFHLAFQQDGNLVVYGYIAEPTMRRVVVSATGTNGFGPDIYLRMNVGGWLEILDKNNNAIRWCRPSQMIGGIALNIPHGGTPDSTLHMKSDGTLLILRPDASTVWEMGRLHPNDVVNCVPPNILVIQTDGVVGAQPTNKTIVNNTNQEIGVRGGPGFVCLGPNASVGVASNGTILASGARYNFNDPNQATTGDAIAQRQYGPGQDVIEAKNLPGGGIALT